MVKWGRFVFLSGFPLFIFSGVLKTSPTVAGNPVAPGGGGATGAAAWSTTRAPVRDPRPLCDWTTQWRRSLSDNKWKLGTRPYSGYDGPGVYQAMPVAAAGWSAVHCVCRLVCSRENRETYNRTHYSAVLYVCLRGRHQRANKPALLLDLSSSSDTEVGKESKILQNKLSKTCSHTI